MIHPPPIPMEWPLRTPLQRAAARAASIVVPFFSRMSRPIPEHWTLSTATAARAYLPSIDEPLMTYVSWAVPQTSFSSLESRWQNSQAFFSPPQKPRFIFLWKEYLSTSLSLFSSNNFDPLTSVFEDINRDLWVLSFSYAFVFLWQSRAAYWRETGSLITGIERLRQPRPSVKDVLTFS